MVRWVIIILILFFLAALYFSKRLYIPWFSPEMAAEYLLLDDGKDPLNDARNAALYWRGQIYSPLSLKTNAFSGLKLYSSYTLLEIIDEDPLLPSWVYEELFNSENDYAKILSCHLSVRRKDPTRDLECKNMLNDIANGSDYGNRIVAKKSLELLAKRIV